MKHSATAWAAAVTSAGIATLALGQHLTRLGVRGTWESAQVGAQIGLTFVATSFAINYAFGGASMGLLFIDAGFHVAQLALAGAILGSPVGGY